MHFPINPSQESARFFRSGSGQGGLRAAVPAWAVGERGIRFLVTVSLAFWLPACLMSEEEQALRELQTSGIPATTASVFAALESRDEALLQRLLRVSVSLNGRNGGGQTPLVAAIVSENPAAVEALLPHTSAGLMAVEDDSGMTALGYAVARKNRALVRELLRCGASADVTTETGEHAVAFAVREGDTEMTRLLLGDPEASGVDPDALQEPLYAAVKAGNAEVTQLLLKAGAGPNYLSIADGRSPLAAAVESDDVRMARLLAENGAAMLCVLPASSVAEASDAGARILEPQLINVAFDHENMEMVQLLIGLNAPLDHPSADGATPLQRALIRKDICLVELLLQHGADPEDTLFMALEQPDAAVIDLLLAHGASLNRTNAAGDTPLHIAIDRGDQTLIDQLMESEPDLSQTGRHGQTPLALAAARQNLPLMRLLLERGADPNQVFADKDLQQSFTGMISSERFLFYLKNDTRLTPIMLAAAYGNVEMTRLLMEHGARRFKTSGKYRRWPVNFACDGEHIACAQLLLGRDPESDRDVHVVISLTDQEAFLYRDGALVLSTGVSTGMKGHRTPIGQFLVTHKSRHHTSSIYGSPMPYFQRLSCQAFGFHVGSCPGYPASHGCIRMPEKSAKAFWDITRVGDPVQILP